MAGTVGPPLPCTAFRLEAVPEMNYSPSELRGINHQYTCTTRTNIHCLLR